MPRSLRLVNLPGVLGAGALSGLAGGLAAALAIVVAARARDLRLDSLVQLVANQLAGVRFGDEPGSPSVAAAAGALLVAAVLWGALFAVTFWGLRKRAVFVAGVLFGLFAWFVTSSLVFPLGAPGATSTAAQSELLVAVHAIYGLVLGATYGWLQPVLTNERLLFRHRRTV